MHTTARKADGTIWSCGDNEYGKLGLGDTIDRDTLTKIGTDTDWAVIKACSCNTFAIKTDGTLWAWGLNDRGQLGLGDTINRTIPTRVGSNTNWQSVDAGVYHTIARKTDGTIWGWGQNGWGELGLGDTTNRTTPTKIGIATDWVAIATGNQHTIARKTNGTLWTWGRNNSSALGLGSPDEYSHPNPTQIGTSTDWVAMAGGVYCTIAIKANGTIWAWGSNWLGQLGFGNSGPGTERNTPTQIGSDTNWTGVTCGTAHTLALKGDGTLWTWGWAVWRALGVGYTNEWEITIPTQVQVGQ
jgi:alpha-tubulin suppressor-like RCC1 family protein